jgi:hypothetical protein
MLPQVPSQRLGLHAAGWQQLLAVLPALLRTDAARVLRAVGRVDVLPVLLELPGGAVAPGRLERALLTLWLAIAGHPGLGAPIALRGPFCERVVDPGRPRVLTPGAVRGLIASATGAAVVVRGGRKPIDELAAMALPAVAGTVIVDEQLAPPGAEIVTRVRAALAAVERVLPPGRLERVTVGGGEATLGEARVGPGGEPAVLVASAHAAFVKAAAPVETVAGPGALWVEGGRRQAAADVLAQASGRAVALPWRRDGADEAAAIADVLDELEALVELTPTGAGAAAAIRASTGNVPAPVRRRALLVNLDADDFIYSFQFGRAVERRCVERGLRVDRIAVDPQACGEMAAELGGAIPAPVADGTELLMESEDAPVFRSALRRLSTRRYEVVVANVRPRQFFDLLEAGLLDGPTLLWDRHLHGGLREEGARRGLGPDRLHGRALRAWSLADRAGQGLHRDLAAAGVEHGSGHAWAIDLEFFRSTAVRQPDRLFAGGDNGRDWPSFVAAVRDLPLDVHVVTGAVLADLPAHVRLECRLPLCRFRDAIAEAAILALPLLPDVAAGVTVLPMAMALGTPVVATRTIWTEQYVTDGEHALLVAPGDVRALRAALVRLLEDVDLRARLAANARRRAVECCDLEGFTREMFGTLDVRGRADHD